MIGENDELLAEKANAYCFFVKYTKSDIDAKLFDRCIKYLDEMSNYNEIKNTLENISRKRKMV